MSFRLNNKQCGKLPQAQAFFLLKERSYGVATLDCCGFIQNKLKKLILHL